MVTAESIRGLFVDSPRSFAERARRARWAQFVAAYPELPEWRVVDLGGTVDFWSDAPVRPREVVVVNTAPDPDDPPPGVTSVVADACQPPPDLRNGGFDLAFSNSVIEHVGGHPERREFAESVHELAPHHWVQTPYRYFPLEPHWLVPGAHLLPIAARAQVVLRWPLVPDRPINRELAMERVSQIELLGRAQFHHYFPDSRIREERVFGMTKSLIATDRF